MSQPIGEPGKRYDKDFHQRVVDWVTTDGNGGISAAAREFGCDKASVSRWLQERGIDPASVAKKTTDQQRGAAQASVAARNARREAAKENMADALITIAALAAQTEIQYLRGERRVTRQVNDLGELLGYEHVKLSEVVGSRTRAIHDLLLLTGGETERIVFRPSTEQVMLWRDDLAQRRTLREVEGA